MDRWSYDNINEWLELWAIREFGSELSKEIADIVNIFSKYAAWRKFELIDVDVFSIVNYNEAELVLEKWLTLENRAKEVYDKLPSNMKDAYFQMILHPIKAGYVVYQIYINSAKNSLYVEQKRSSSNRVAYKVLDLFKDDRSITNEYHSLLGGKWNHMMDQTHLGYNYWQQPMRDALPPLRFVQGEADAITGQVGIGVEGTYASVPGDDRYHELSGKVLTTPPMDRYGPKSRYIDVFSRETGCSKYEFVPNVDYVTVSPSSGTVCGSDEEDTRVEITVNWSAAPEGHAEDVFIDFSIVPSSSEPHNWGSNRNGQVQVRVPIHNNIVPEDFKQGFVESDGHISIEAEHASRMTSTADTNYIVIPDFGHTLSGVTLWPVLSETQFAPNSPALEYDFYSFTNIPLANITVYCAPSLNFNGRTRHLKYAIAIDDEIPAEVQVVPTSEDGTLPEGWEQAVSDNIWKPSSLHLIFPGAHKLRIWAIEPGVVIQKIVIDLGGVRESYFGPPESFQIKQHKPEDQNRIQLPIRLRAPLPQASRIPHGRTTGTGEGDSSRDNGTTSTDTSSSTSYGNSVLYEAKKQLDSVSRAFFTNSQSQIRPFLNLFDLNKI